jgi:hypothetical protein
VGVSCVMDTDDSVIITVITKSFKISLPILCQSAAEFFELKREGANRRRSAASPTAKRGDRGHTTPRPVRLRSPARWLFSPHPSPLTPHPPCILLFLWWVAPFLRRRKTRKIDRRLKNAVIGGGRRMGK